MLEAYLLPFTSLGLGQSIIPVLDRDQLELNAPNFSFKNTPSCVYISLEVVQLTPLHYLYNTLSIDATFRARLRLLLKDSKIILKN